MPSMHMQAIDARRTDITTDDWKAIIVKRDNSNMRHWDSNTRLYGAINTFSPDLEEKIHENACSPAWGDGDGFTEETRAAHMTEYRRLKRQALAQAKASLVLPIEFLHAHLARFGTDKPTAKFSSNAGCSMCACS